MITFLICLAVLIIGYFTYGRVTEKIMGPDDKNITPAHRLADGVDYVVLPWHKVLLTQFLNIAGLGPIFGAVMGAMFGPVVFLWITLGTLFIGGVHDMITSYVSLKHDGIALSELVGIYLGKWGKRVMLFFTVILSILVGVVFTMSPAGWLNSRIEWGMHTWIIIIMIYYVFATLVPVKTIMAKLFPLFSFSMLLMCVVLFIAMMWNQFTNPTFSMVEFTFNTVHPAMLSPLPFLFVTVACGAVSGFHAAKSPMMVRCLNKESQTKKVFFGAMVIEGIVALVWAAVAMAVLGDTFWGDNPTTVGALGGAGVLVDQISYELLGGAGVFLVIIAVIIVPITTGDTTFRSLRITLADTFKFSQASMMNRILLCIPMFATAFVLTFINFDILWRYFAWTNQTIAALALWTCAAWLTANKKIHWIASLPAMLLTYVSFSYILQAPEEGFGLSAMIGNSVGISAAILAMVVFLFLRPKERLDFPSNAVLKGK
ncbi:MAG: carbon starvation protein A [Defluviitaleaceae bacterium]|nr:carbon starvation protein A [Defluviitaleaceae bacterium]